jgi:hypothetical protein
MLDNWHVMFPGCEPIGHRLRTAFSTRWVRFHSLPGSKRYPEDEGEYGTLLDRHNRVLGELVGSEPSIILLTTSYSENWNAVPRQPELQALDPDAKPWRSVPMHELEAHFADPTYWHVFASVWRWRVGILDPILRLVADDVIANVMVVDPGCSWLLHPYDGGMDVILGSADARNHLKSSHVEWLSPRADGL